MKSTQKCAKLVLHSWNCFGVISHNIHFLDCTIVDFVSRCMKYSVELTFS